MFYALVIVIAMVGCAGSKKPKKIRTSLADSSSLKAPVEDDDSGPVTIAGSKGTLSYSLSQNRMTGKRLDTKKASEYSSDLKGATKKADFKKRLQFEGYVIARALSGAGFDDVLAASRRLMGTLMSKKVDSELPPGIKLQLALAALKSGRYTMVSHFLSQVRDAKSPKLKAAALNLEGLLALRDERLPEAAEFWQESLKVVSNYKPARLNLGFLALKYGDHITAKKMLGSMQNDWFAVYGLVVAERLAGNSSRVVSLCRSLEGKKKNFKPGMLSCALNKYQGRGDYAGAKKDLQKIVGLKSGSTVIDEYAYKALAQIDKDEAKMRAAKSKSVAKSAKKSATKKTKAPKK